MADHLGRVVGPAAPREQPPDELVLGDVEVHRDLHADPEVLRHRVRGLGLLDRAREPVEDVAAGLVRRHHRLAQHVQHDGVGHQVAAALT